MNSINYDILHFLVPIHTEGKISFFFVNFPSFVRTIKFPTKKPLLYSDIECQQKMRCRK